MTACAATAWFATHVGPSFQRNAERYRAREDAADYLARKIREGGAGEWGRAIMPRHPHLDTAQSPQMATWLLSLPSRVREILTMSPLFTAPDGRPRCHWSPRFTEDDVLRLLGDAGIVRHRGKIEAVINNAQRGLGDGEGGRLAVDLLLAPCASPVTGGGPVSETAESRALPKELKKLGWKFVGPTTVYSFMQAMGWSMTIFGVCALGAPQETPSKTTIYNVLKAEGLFCSRRVRRRPRCLAQPLRTSKQPNGVWSADYKGQFKTADGHWCYPLTIMAHASRYLLAVHVYDSPNYEDAKRSFEQVFRQYGLPERIRSDNDPPFATTGVAGLSAWRYVG
ncbi:Mitochondrial pyruvate carrier 2 [Manis javanica]|nr:Mitochondrial pyruvate carrier 2 [Manis javanica]